MFGDSNSSELQEQVLDLTDRMYNSWVNWVKYKIKQEIILPNKICFEITVQSACVHLHNLIMSMCFSGLLCLEVI